MDDQKASRIYLILQNVSNKITSIENSSNVSMALLKSDMLNIWHCLNMAYKKFVEVRDINNIEDVLDSKYCKEAYANLRAKIDTIISKQFDFFRNISQEENCYIEVANISIEADKNAIINEYTEIINSKNNSILNDFCDKEYTGYFYNDIEREFVETGRWSQFEYEQSKNADIGFTQVVKSLDVFKKAWEILSSYDDFVIKDRDITIEDYKRALTNRVRLYSIQCGDIVLKEQKKLIKRYKSNKSQEPTPEMWGDMLEEYETNISQCISNGNVDVSLFSNDIQFTQSMSQNQMLLKAFCECSSDDELFNIDDSISENSPLYTCLTKYNLHIFLTLVLRSNLIKCEMKPQLKREYTLWLEEGRRDPSLRFQSEQSKVFKPCIFFNEKMFNTDDRKRELKEALQPVIDKEVKERQDWYAVLRGVQSVVVKKDKFGKKHMVLAEKASDVDMFDDLCMLMPDLIENENIFPINDKKAEATPSSKYKTLRKALSEERKRWTIKGKGELLVTDWEKTEYIPSMNELSTGKRINNKEEKYRRMLQIGQNIMAALEQLRDKYIQS